MISDQVYNAPQGSGSFVAPPLRRRGIAWLRALAGKACPICVLAALVGLMLAAGAGGVVMLDRGRSLDAAELTGRQVADLARQRSADLLVRIDGALRLLGEQAEAIDRSFDRSDATVRNPGGAAQTRLDSLLAQRRRSESRIIGLYLVDPAGAVLAHSSATSFGVGALLPACLRDEHIEPDILTLRRLGIGTLGTAPPPESVETGSAGVVCAVRGLPAPPQGAAVSARGLSAGAVVALLAPELFTAEYADLAVGPHGLIALRDENGRLLARIVEDGRPVAQSPEAAAEARRFSADGLRAGSGSAAGGITALRRIDGPVSAVVAVSLSRDDVLRDWWFRSLLTGGSLVTVVVFVGLALVALRRFEGREADRVERLAGVSAALQGITDPRVLAERLVEQARALVPCEPVIGAPVIGAPVIGAPVIGAPVVGAPVVGAPAVGAPAEAPAEQAGGPPTFRLVLLRYDLVQIGPAVLRSLKAAGFTQSDIAYLRLLAQFAEVGQRHAGAMLALQESTGGAAKDYQSVSRVQEAILLEMSDARITLDGEWRFTGSNRAADRLFEEYPEDLLGRSIWTLFPELAGSLFESELRRAARGGHQADFDLHWMRSNRRVHVRVFPKAPAGAAADGEGPPRGMAIYLQDIGERLSADDKLMHTDRLDAVGRLTGGIAHDFNNLLTVMLGNLEMLDQELPEDGEIREMHEQIRRAAQNASGLTHQLLAFARRQPLSPSDVDVGRLIAGLDGLLRRDLGAGVALELACPPTLWPARADPVQLEAALLHLATNAREAMPDGGRLSITAVNLAIRKPDIDAFGEIRAGNYVMIAVADTGRGIARDMLGQVFDPFFSTKPPGRATGLGLSTVYGFVIQSGGNVRITSEPGRGTTVRVYLPSPSSKLVDEMSGAGLRRPAPIRGGNPGGGAKIVDFSDSVLSAGRNAGIAGGGRHSDGNKSGLQGGRETLLLVEDSDMVRDYARHVLEGLGYTVRAASDAAEALALLDAGLAPDLLLSDVLLPNGMNGLELADAAMLRQPDLPVLFMSGYIENVDVHHHRLDPASNLLLKPFRRASIARMVRTRLDRAAES